MKVNRRGFLKIGGLAVLGIVTKPASDVLSGFRLPRASSAGEALVGDRWAMVVNLKACGA